MKSSKNVKEASSAKVAEITRITASSQVLTLPFFSKEHFRLASSTTHLLERKMIKIDQAEEAPRGTVMMIKHLELLSASKQTTICFPAASQLQ